MDVTLIYGFNEYFQTGFFYCFDKVCFWPCLQPLARPLVARIDTPVSILPEICLSLVALHIFFHFIYCFLCDFFPLTATNSITDRLRCGVCTVILFMVGSNGKPDAPLYNYIFLLCRCSFCSLFLRRSHHLNSCHHKNSSLISQRAARCIFCIHPNPV